MINKSDAIEVVIEKLKLDCILGFFEKKNINFSRKKVSTVLSGLNEKYLLGSSDHGLCEVTQRGVYTVLNDKGVYGITYDVKHIYVYLKGKRVGKLVRICRHNYKAVETVLYGLSKGVHQIDIYKDDMFITDTYNNRIIKLPRYKNVVNKYWRSNSESYSVNGKLRIGRFSKNYSHINSLWINKGLMYLVAHNETKKTGKKSELIILSVKAMEEIDREFLKGGNCHNIFIKNGINYCSSLESGVFFDNYFFKLTGFTRGVAYTESDGLIIGSSSLSFSRDHRSSGVSSVYQISAEKKPLKAFDITGQVNEIRCLTVKDIAMSRV